MKKKKKKIKERKKEEKEKLSKKKEKRKKKERQKQGIYSLPECLAFLYTGFNLLNSLSYIVIYELVKIEQKLF